MPGNFLAKDESKGMKGTMSACNYNDRLNFNLLNLMRLLCNGWRITKGDATGITVRHESGGKIKFDIVIPMTRKAIHAC